MGRYHTGKPVCVIALIWGLGYCFIRYRKGARPAFTERWGWILGGILTVVLLVMLLHREVKYQERKVVLGRAVEAVDP